MEPEPMHVTPDETALTKRRAPSMHGLQDEQSVFTLLVRLIQRSLFATPCAQSATPHGVRRPCAAFATESAPPNL
jgi:hypothetical protein